MKSCPFCGSPAAQWPEYASDYVRGYPLCEHHMGLVLKTSVIKEWPDRRVKYIERWEAIQSAVHDALFDFIESVKGDPVEPSYGDDIKCKPCADYANKLFDMECPIELGSPTKIYIDEQEVDRLISVRIKGFAYDIEKGKDAHRCSSYRSESPDNRCVNRVGASGDICSQCQCQGRGENKSLAVTAEVKMEKIIAAIREDSENEKPEKH